MLCYALRDRLAMGGLIKRGSVGGWLFSADSVLGDGFFRGARLGRIVPYLLLVRCLSLVWGGNE